MPLLLVAVNACTKTTTADAVVGWVIILALIGSIALFATLNVQARKKLALAHAELAYLRPENERLRTVVGGTGTPGPVDAGATAPVNPGWYPDPTGRHEYRLWDGYTWGPDVSDHGVASRDPLTH